MEFFDPARVVAFPTLSLASGAIKGWDRRNGYYFAMLESLAKHYKFDIDASRLNPAARGAAGHAARLGRGRNQVQLRDGLRQLQAGKKLTKKHPFEGIIPTWRGATARPTRRLVREDLARYRSTSPARLRWHAPAPRSAPREGW
jgi:excinuclease ABC subunit A